MDIDAIELAFDENALAVLQIALSVVMFGVALDLGIQDFVNLAKDPRAPLVGLFCQFVLLPALTFPLAILVAPIPSMALGMILVAACPGGNVSNFLTQLAHGRVTVSVGMTAVSTVAAVFTTPFNLTFWGSLHPSTAKLVTAVSLDPFAMLQSVALLLLVPVLLGMGCAAYAPAFAARLRPVMKGFSILFLLGVLVSAFSANLGIFVQAIGIVFVPVLLLNALALGLGYGASRLAGLQEDERRAVSFEVGIQNSGLGLVLIFSFFDGLGGMTVVAAWWGIWHLISGFSLAAFWLWKDRRKP
ncbi:MAG: bile acid:sodium symporter family protein [Alphaproteobacteria bacterium]|nr:bile acid:sodium symporter family protein [Alphaproteobacteria bacterium]